MIFRRPLVILLLLLTLGLSGCAELSVAPALSLLGETTPTPLRTLEPLPGVPTPTPAIFESERIAFVSSRGGSDDIYVINADGSGLARLTDDSARDSDPAWGPIASALPSSRIAAVCPISS